MTMSWLPPELIAIIGLYLNRDELSVMSLSCQAYHDALRAIIFQNIKIDSDEDLCQLDELPKRIANAAVRHVTLRHREGISMAYHQAYAYEELARFTCLKSLKVEIRDKESCHYTLQHRPGHQGATGFTHMLHDLRHLMRCLSRIDLPLEHLAIKLESSHICEPLTFRDLPPLPPLKTFSVNFAAYPDDLKPNFNLLLLSVLTPSQHTLTTLEWNIMVDLEEIDELAPVFALMPNVTDVTFIWSMLCLANTDELVSSPSQFCCTLA
ncbi:hypothetical protein ONZ45_g5052 [Pleurotus djamor]|nr:hypothetical protein ONZ45_g5052 [Pleurotus djamor]